MVYAKFNFFFINCCIYHPQIRNSKLPTGPTLIASKSVLLFYSVNLEKNILASYILDFSIYIFYFNFFQC